MLAEHLSSGQNSEGCLKIPIARPFDCSDGPDCRYGRFRRDLGCGKAVKSRGRGAKMIWGRPTGGNCPKLLKNGDFTIIKYN